MSQRETEPLVHRLTPEWRVLEGDARSRLGELDEGSVRCCVTSPPYFGLRDYGHDGQIGLESTVDDYVAALVEVFRAVRRVLADDGTLWLNLGDSYAAQGGAHGGREDNQRGVGAKRAHDEGAGDQVARRPPAGVKPKDLLGVPWAVAFALRADGWYLRAENIWSKPNPMPESVTDRPTRAHEQVFLLSKSARYFYDADAIAEPTIGQSEHDITGPGYAPPGQAPRNGSRKPGQRVNETQHYGAGNGGNTGLTAHLQRYHGDDPPTMRNKRSVWEVTTAPFPGAHFATFPPKLIEPCILAGSALGNTVLDPFSGSGTTGVVALRHGRSYIGCELNPEYVALSRDRIIDDAPLLNQVAEAA